MDGVRHIASRFSTSTGMTAGGTPTSTGSATTIGGTPTIVSCSATLSSSPSRESFLFTIAFPSRQHLARFDEVFRNVSVLCIGENSHLPRDEEKEFCKVKPPDCRLKGQHLVLFSQVSSAERLGECLKQFRIYAPRERLATDLIDVRQKTLPDQIRVFQPGNHGNQLWLQKSAGGGAGLGAWLPCASIRTRISSLSTTYSALGENSCGASGRRKTCKSSSTS